MRGIQTNEKVDIRPGDGGRKWDRMVRLEVLKIDQVQVVPSGDG